MVCKACANVIEEAEAEVAVTVEGEGALFELTIAVGSSMGAESGVVVVVKVSARSWAPGGERGRGLGCGAEFIYLVSNTYKPRAGF